MQYGSEVTRYFEATSHLYLQGQGETSSKPAKTGSVFNLLLSGVLDSFPLTLNMKGICPSETSGFICKMHGI
jgi:hypothetical protein